MEHSERKGNVAVVAIVSYGRPKDVVACLSSLEKSDISNFEVVVVENAGAIAFDNLSAVLAGVWRPYNETVDGAPPVANPERAGCNALRTSRLVLAGGQPVLLAEATTNLGYSGAVNVALRCLSESAGWAGVWVLNPDTEPEPAALRTVMAYAASGYGMVGCRLVLSSRNVIQTRGGGRWRRVIGRAKSIGWAEAADSPADVSSVERELQWISGAAAYATREYVETVGLMSEKYFLYCEDVEWSLRRGHFRLGYAHDAIVHHAHGTTIGSSTKISNRSNLSVYLAARNVLLLTRDCFPLFYPITVLATFVLLPDCLVRGNWRVFVAACRGWWAGILGETGNPGARA